MVEARTLEKAARSHIGKHVKANDARTEDKIEIQNDVDGEKGKYIWGFPFLGKTCEVEVDFCKNEFPDSDKTIDAHFKSKMFHPAIVDENGSFCLDSLPWG